MVIINPKWVISDLLRHRLVDPRNRAEDSTTETLSALTGTTTFTLSPPSGSVACVTAVTVNSVAKNKWQDYYMNFKKGQVIFFSGLTAGDSVAITYKYGSTNWIYPEKANKTLSAAAFPRVNIMIISGPGKRLGNYEAPVECQLYFQIDVWAKEKQDGQIFSIDSVKYTGEALADYIAWKITEAFEEHENDLHPVLYNYIPTQIPRDMPFDVDFQCHHKVIELMLNGLKVGRVS